MAPVDLIFVSMEDWDDTWRRNQFVCAELARRHPDMKILFVGLPRNLSHDLRHGRIGSVRKAASWKVPGLDNVTVTHPWKLLPNTLTLGRKLNERGMRRHVGRVAADMGIVKPLLWLNPHYAVHMTGRMGERAVVYDVTDDWISLSQRQWLTDLIRQQDAELCRKADAVIVCSRRLFEMKRELAENLHLIPNGVDAEHYRKVLDGTDSLPEATRKWKKPVLGYTGTIHPDRLDVGLVEAVARKMPDASVVLMGPSFLPAEDLSRLQSCANIFLTGPVAYKRIPDYMRAFDVCITPHHVSEFTESLNPIKLWEYLAAGKPMVSTDIAGFRDYPQFVRIARGAEEFVDAVKQALAEGHTDAAVQVAQERRREAARHSWESRVDQIRRVLAGCMGDPNPELS